MMEIVKGNEAAAIGAKLARPDVVAAYPITPSTDFPEKMSEYVANGELPTTEFVPVESEHSAMSACIGASAAGARVCTATSSQGLELMHEMLFVASGMRLPIVLYNASRALSAPINIWNDQQDSIAARDVGWIQMYAENNQEGLDLMIMAFKIAERALLPAMVCLDAFYSTHTFEPVDIPSQKEVDKFLPTYKPTHVALDPYKPMTVGPFGGPEIYQELRYTQYKAMEEVPNAINEVFHQFKEKFGREYKKVEEYMAHDADILLLTMGSISGTVKEVVEQLRKKGKKVGVIKLTVFRPFPDKEVTNAIQNASVVGIIEKNISPGYGGAVFADIAGIFANKNHPLFLDFICGLGGRDVTYENIEEIVKTCEDALEGDYERINWIGLEEDVL